MKTTNKYPVYEKDQVLSAQNLNDTTQYLEHQDLLTRRLLIGTGIACGLELNLTEEELKISAGNGVTSMGYLIDFCGDKSYTQVRDYTLPANPKYLPFHDKKNKPFKLWELCEEKEELGENLTAFKKLGANFFRDKVVVLFLEIEHVDLKNCIEGDCDDKGSELVFTVRPLLVLLKDLMLYFSKDDDTLEDLNSAILAKYAIKKIVCPRFDVLAQRLTNHNQIAEVFSDNISTVVPRIDIALTFIETLYEDKLEATKILTQRWAQVKKVIEAAKKDPETVQLAYDYVCDLSAAINEFSKEASEWMVECCPDIDLFPQHLALGELANLGQDVPKLFRNYFVHAPTSPAAHQKLGAVKFYLDRVLGILTEYRFFEEKEIKIIPSVYGKEPLSEKAIPFYLQPNEKSNWNWLRQWNFKKNNFGGWKYNNYYYNNPEAVLDLDIEEYSFFRIDGHVGKNYQDALREVQSKINSYRVPIKVMALSTGGVPVDANPIPESRFQDLEALFDAAKTELFCGLEAPLCAVASINPAANTNRAVDVKAAAPNFSFSDILGSQFTATVNAASATYTHYTPQARMFTYKQVIIQHVKGQFLSQKCDVREGSFGRAYLDLVKNEPFKSSRILELYQNYIGLGTPTSGKIILFLLITIDEIEELVGLIKPATLSNFKFDELKAFILGFRNFLDQFIDLLDKYIAASDGEIPYYLEGLSDKLKSLKAICTLKKIVGILNEHRLRTLEILEEWRFENFTQKHPGIDHKSGTTKGGTLLLVYHSTEKTEQYKPFTLDKLNLKLPAMNLMATVYASKKEGGENTRTAAMKMAEAYEIGTAKKTLAEEAHAFAESRGLKINPEILNRFGDMFISGIDRKDEVVATDGMVLFDFFLPYVCCGEGGTQINLPEPKVLIALEDRQFCKNDENSYEFTLSPAGGQVTGPGVEESEEGYSFSPSAEDVPLGKVSFTYVAQGRTATFAVNVEEAPEADFEYSTDGGSVGTYVSFENKS
ncbi:MAG: hypothetical protein N4A46_12555, partial [Schleiferiaceae bacterium]|nr:hypothetical protein [Schleiferiaceae bacterium]